jgi:hypothetical protein
MKYLLILILSSFLSAIAVHALEVEVTATVPVHYSCHAEGFDLVVETNAQRIIRK